MSELTPELFDGIRQSVYERCGVRLSQQKEYLVRQRLGPLLRQYAHLRDWPDLVAALLDGRDRRLTDDIVHRITTHETSFFRDHHPFQILERVLLPRFAQQIRTRKSGAQPGNSTRFRFLNAAVSSGQEAYSLAMVCDRFCRKSQGHGIHLSDWSILATDISCQILAQAEAGLYQDHEIKRGLATADLQEYFQRTDQGWRIDERLRALVRFEVRSLTEPFTDLGRFDMIWCRNVLIYFDDIMRRRILDQFAAMLSPRGVLLLGSSEHIMPAHPCFIARREGQTGWYERVC